MSDTEEEEEEVSEYEYDSAEEVDDGATSNDEGCGNGDGGVDGSDALAAGDNQDDDDQDDDLLPPPPAPPGSMLRTNSGREVPASLARQVSYTVVDSDFVLRKRAKMVENIMDYGLSAEDATTLLGKCHWTAADVDMDGILEATDAMVSPLEPLSSSSSSASSSSSSDDAHYPECVVCGDTVPPSLLYQAGKGASSDAVFRGDLGCGHVQCRECWGGFLDVALLNRGSAVVGLSCFYSDGKTACPRAVPLAFFEAFCSPSRWKMYQERLVEDFVDSNATMAFCPRPDCGRVVSYQRGVGGFASRDVQCLCGQYFCFSCSAVAHQPLGCLKANLWHKKEASDQANK